jgi:uncharacterized protein (UPF0262 family)
MSDAKATQFLKSILIDEDSLAAASRDQEQERQVAIFDLLDGNYFEPAEVGGRALRPEAVAGREPPGLRHRRPGRKATQERRHLLSLSPFRGVIKDYFMICDSYYSAIRNSSPQQIEALDMGRRGLHNEGSNLLRERLEGKVKTDLDTARRLFTLICALHWRG